MRTDVPQCLLPLGLRLCWLRICKNLMLTAAVLSLSLSLYLVIISRGKCNRIRRSSKGCRKKGGRGRQTAATIVDVIGYSENTTFCFPAINFDHALNSTCLPVLSSPFLFSFLFPFLFYSPYSFPSSYLSHTHIRT